MMRQLLPLLLTVVQFQAVAQTENFANGSTVTNFTVTDTDGNTHELYQYTAQGKHVMLDFFYVACVPCQSTQPYYNQLHEVYGCNSAELVVLSINSGVDNDAEVIAFQNAYGGAFRHAPTVSSQGGGGAVRSMFGVTGFPTYCLIKPDNKMHNNDIWPISNMQSYVNAFPAGSGIQTAPCLVGIAEQDSPYNASVHPVPTSGALSIEFATPPTTELFIEVHDPSGRIVRTERLQAYSAQLTMDLSALSDGQYLLRFLGTDGPAVTKRIVIAH
jgi:thiol-disulfide isomerase/thioredoxin